MHDKTQPKNVLPFTQKAVDSAPPDCPMWDGAAATEDGWPVRDDAVLNEDE